MTVRVIPTPEVRVVVAADERLHVRHERRFASCGQRIPSPGWTVPVQPTDEITACRDCNWTAVAA